MNRLYLIDFLGKRSPGALQPKHWIAMGGAIWLICIIVGFRALLIHDTETSQVAGQVGGATTTPASLSSQIAPQDLQALTPNRDKLHLIMALHPKCPCTKTTMRELERLIAIDPIRTRCTFLVHLPLAKPFAWMDTQTIEMARSLPNVKLVVDHHSTYAKRLGLKRSGEALVITQDGEVLFRGGITAGRSCLMENPGSQAVENLVHRIAISPLTTPTFGCLLQ